MTETAAPTGSVWSHVLGYVSVIGPPATVVTALVFYFGWARAKAQAEWMGLHVNLFGYTTRDFALLSISALYLPLLLLIALAMLWVWLDRLLRRRIDRGAAGRWATALPRAALLGAGALIGLMVVLLFAERVYSPLYAPYLVTAGVLVAAWAVRIRRCAAAVEGPRRPAEQQAVEATLLLVLVALLLFWGTSNFAEARGRGLAEDLEVNLPWLPRAQVYSQEPLGLDVLGSRRTSWARPRPRCTATTGCACSPSAGNGTSSSTRGGPSRRERWWCCPTTPRCGSSTGADPGRGDRTSPGACGGPSARTTPGFPGRARTSVVGRGGRGSFDQPSAQTATSAKRMVSA